MKQLIAVILISAVLISCKGKVPNHVTNDTVSGKATLDLNEVQKLIKQFSPIISGVWVKQDYIDKVIKTKSPWAAMDLSGLMTFKISLDSIRGDSLAAHGCNSHEGTDMMIKFHAGKRPSTILFNSGELGYEVNGRDTLLILYNNESYGSSIVKYTRALKKSFKQDPGEVDDGLVYLMNKGLVAGKYFVIDSLGKKADVVLTPFGKITGLSSFKSYMIDTALGGEPMSNLDEIIFDIYTKQQVNYTFKIKADTLSLYETRPNADSTLLLVDKLKYKLIRKR